MRQTVLAKRYAKALFELATERKILETTAREIRLFQELLQGNEDLRHFFLSPEISRERKIETLEKNFQDRFSGLFLNFLFVLLQKGRQEIFDEISLEFERLFDKHLNRVRAKAVTAIPLTPKDLEDIGDRLAKQYKATFELENQVDPEVLGGVILQIDGRVIDASLLTQLQKLKHHLVFGKN